MKLNLFKRKEKLGEKLLGELEKTAGKPAGSKSSSFLKKESENKQASPKPAESSEKSEKSSQTTLHEKLPMHNIILPEHKEELELPAFQKEKVPAEKAAEPAAEKKKTGFLSKLKMAKEKFSAKKQELKEKGKEKTIGKADGKDKPEASPLAPKQEKKFELKLKRFNRYKNKGIRLKNKKKFSIGGFAKSISLRDYLVKSGMEDLEPKAVIKKILDRKSVV